MSIFSFFADETVILGIIMFMLVIFTLVAIILVARFYLVSSGLVNIEVNGNADSIIKTPAGSKLLNTLASEDIFLSSACGGGGTCGQCRCQVVEGGGAILSTEKGHFTRREIQENWRLSCQVTVKQDLKINIPEDAFGVKRWECEVLSNDSVATFIKELVLKLPEDVNFRAGGFVQLEIPPYNMSYETIDVDDIYKADWERFRSVRSDVSDVTVRAYSMANYPEERGVLKFNIRVATPFPNDTYPPGQMSSYIFNLKKGDKLTVFGPYGEFFVQDTPAEKIWIGGGAGMAPLRSQIFDELKRKNSDCKMSFWYGARSLRELFYQEDFDTLAEQYSNFSWNIALSDPLPEDDWKGPVGFIHQVVLDEYLSEHPNPDDCEYYLCGPPMMNAAVLSMLHELGVEDKDIRLDDFG